MRELTFLSDTASTQVEATLTARELSEPLSPIRNSYNTTLIRLTDAIVVQCVEYAVSVRDDIQRKDAFATARRIQRDFVTDTPKINTCAVGKEFGIKMAKQILDKLCPEKNPMNLGSKTVPLANPANLTVVNSRGVELGELFKTLVNTQTRIGEILTEHLSYVRPA